MPAIRRASLESPVAEPYSLTGTHETQLSTLTVPLTVTALKPYLNNYHLSTTGNKARITSPSNLTLPVALIANFSSSYDSLTTTCQPPATCHT